MCEKSLHENSNLSISFLYWEYMLTEKTKQVNKQFNYQWCNIIEISYNLIKHYKNLQWI